MSERFSFTIDRSKWWRGKGCGDSRLLRPDGCRCCVGFYLAACGVSDSLLLSANYFPKIAIGSAAEVDHDRKDKLPEHAKWLHHTRYNDPLNAYITNDCEEYSEAEREERLTAIFATQNIDVTFVDGAP